MVHPKVDAEHAARMFAWASGSSRISFFAGAARIDADGTRRRSETAQTSRCRDAWSASCSDSDCDGHADAWDTHGLCFTEAWPPRRARVFRAVHRGFEVTERSVPVADYRQRSLRAAPFVAEREAQ